MDAVEEISTDADDRDDADRDDKRFVTVEGIVVDTVDDGEGLVVDTVDLRVEKLREICQRERRRAEDGKGSEETEVAQQFVLDEDQSDE